MLRDTILILDLEKEELYIALHQVSYEKNELRFNLKQNEELLKEKEARVDYEKHGRKRLGDFLNGEGLKLGQRNQELRDSQ